ncbi:MAG: N-acetyl-gamma-glutamyl-phosphate reductase [Acidobacteria bacterium]|nr:N-acetyl-gamma-glutamyl-phosphate reductase [Acidobacteriota bacterium]
MTNRVSIVGATGYSGAELVSLLAKHPSAEIASVFSSEANAGAPFASIHPSLRGVAGPRVEALDFDALLATDPDTLFLATPNELSAELVPRLAAEKITTIDLSGSFRLRDASLYPLFYGFDHPSAGLLDRAVYGLTEWCNGSLEGATLVANPGCYATSILLALRPLDPLLGGATIICDAKSGVSGAGKRASVDYSLGELAGNFSAYGVAGHRHQPEIASQLGDGPAFLSFVPHLLPIPRGIFSTIHIGFDRSVEPGEMAAAYSEAYDAAPFVHVLDHGDLPSLRSVVGTPHCEIGFQLLGEGRRAVVVSVIDNLLKGAASQAVQNFNRIHGYAETEGLS